MWLSVMNWVTWQHQNQTQTQTQKLTLVVQLEDAQTSLWSRPVVDRQRVGGAADHLTFHQQCVIGQNQRRALLVQASDGQLLAV